MSYNPILMRFFSFTHQNFTSYERLQAQEVRYRYECIRLDDE